MILDMPYTVNDQPSEDWTVDQVLQWWLLHAQSETDAARDEFIERLQSQLDQGKQRLWHDHEQVLVAVQRQKQPLQQQQETMSHHTTENMDPQQLQQQQVPSSSLSVGPTKTSAGGSWKETEQDTTNLPNQEATAAVPAPTTTTSNVPAVRLLVEIVGGEYVGKFFELNHLTTLEPAVVGRSRSKKVLKYGISLPKDPEVSTTHGRFLVKGGGANSRGDTVYFTDDGSTNGSMVNGQHIQSHVDIPLESGMEIQVGGTIMLVTF